MPNLKVPDSYYTPLYLRDWPTLILSIFSTILNFLNIFVLSKNFPQFKMLAFISGADLLKSITVVFIEFWLIIFYTEHLICGTYLNYYDAFFEYIISGIFQFSGFLGFAACGVTVVFRNSKNTMKIAIFASILLIFWFLLSIIFQIYLFLQLPYKPCQIDNSLENYIKNRNWITVIAFLTYGIETISLVLSFLITLSLLIFLGCKKYENDAERLRKLHFSILLSFFIFGPKNMGLLIEFLVNRIIPYIPVNIGYTIALIGPILRPFIIYFRSFKYQKTVGTYFRIPFRRGYVENIDGNNDLVERF
ncbi:Protein CBG27305 [Caenorhabditis briggsae]|uniref:Protein CBG27305 n=1 Tax=Caenorhabditis briggsae TaxID=6238 RepID=B6IKX6_CAEBR|nr:Protein CBG27305 [Caenorhabditis briggsae]CAS00556.1 Protein CBG27305 [Caenorhabditis briggsae]